MDVRDAGSGNIGATNVGRLLGRKYGILCFGLDAAKGAVPVIAMGLIGGVWGEPVIDDTTQWLWLGAAAAALVGHMFPPWLRFKGGKGVATGFGGLLAMWPVLTVPALLALLIWGLVLAATRYVSLSSMLAALSLPITCLVRDASPPVIAVTTALAVAVLWKHRANIGRLASGTESKVGRKKEASSDQSA